MKHNESISNSINQAEKDNFSYQQELLRTTNEVASILLQSDSDEFNTNIKHCMEMMMHSFNSSRMSIWGNKENEGELYATQLYECHDKINPQQDSEKAIDLSYSKYLTGWEAKLSNHECVSGTVSELYQSVEDLLLPQETLSIIVIPIFAEDRFWGFIRFDDCSNERVFTKDEEMILDTAALMFGDALSRREMSEKIDASAALTQVVIENYGGLIWCVDLDMTITVFDGLLLRKLGFEPSFFEGKNLDLALKRGRHEDIIERIKRTVTEGTQDWINEIEGSSFHHHTTPVLGPDGSVISVVGNSEDVSEIIRLQKDLEIAVKDAQAANKAKSNFLSNMSHEMRTPMNAVIGMTSIGKTANTIDRKDYAFNKIEEASTHLLNVINDILDMSKIEAEKFELSEVDFDFEKLLRTVFNVIAFHMDEHSQRLNATIDVNIPKMLCGDDQRLSQVMLNLLSNAYKFTPDEGIIRLEVKLLNCDGNACMIKVDVIDNGIGITPEQQARLFTSFEQAENSTTRKYGGTGLGLALCKRIIDIMGGEISVSSVANVGSTFTFTIPLKISTSQSSPNEGLLQGITLPNLRVLIVDDEKETLNYFKTICERMEILCDTATSKTEAIQLISQKDLYDIYFISWRKDSTVVMELAKLIREHDTKNSIVTIASSSNWAKLESQAREAGVTNHLTIPLLPSSVKACIFDCIDMKNETEMIDEELPTATFPGKHILLAEDVEVNREILLALLEHTGLIFDCAENGLEAVQMYMDAPDKYDLIFMDVQMPELDGLDATRQIRASDHPSAKNIPIIAMTANVFKEDVELCLEAGMTAHIGKPLDIDELMAELQTYLN